MKTVVSFVIGISILLSSVSVKAEDRKCLLEDQKIVKSDGEVLICRNYKKDLILYKYDKDRLVNTVTLFPQRGEYLIYISKSSDDKKDSVHTAFFVDENTRKLTRWLKEGNIFPNYELIKELSKDVSLLIETEKTNSYEAEQF